MEIRRRLGANVRRLQEQKGWSQEKFAFEADIRRTYAFGIERDTRNPTTTVVEKLARALDTTASVLLAESD